MIECIEIGTAIVSYIEPHAGRARDFNRWYERDHFPAAVTAGPGAFAGGRWVATRDDKALRPATGRLFGDPARGSYLGIAWLLPNTQSEWTAWVANEMKTIIADDRLFPGRDHVHTGVYRYRGEVRAAGGPFAALALDRGFAGVGAIALEGDDVDAAAKWAGTFVDDAVPVVALFTLETLMMSVLGDDAVTDPSSHVLALAFLDGDVDRVWRDRIAPALSDGAIAFASPFRRTIPGTDTYTDAL